MEEVFLDFEFNQTTESPVNLVSCATECGRTGEVKKWWLHKDKKAQRKLRTYIEDNFKLITGYACVAEARSFLALGMNPLDFEWYDGFIEYRMVTNHNDELQWGKQLVDGKVKFVKKPKPKYERTDEDEKTGFKATHSLTEATYKLLEVIRDSAHKNKMRDLIISNPDIFTEDEAAAILDYDAEDVVYLRAIKDTITAHVLKLDLSTTKETYLKEALWRGRYSAHTAIMEDRGYPIDYEATRNFSSQVSNILYDCQIDINGQFPEIKPFRWNKAENRMSENQNNIKEWVKTTGHVDKWKKTDTKDISLSLDAFTQFYDYKHDYPRGNFGAQYVRYLKLKQSIYGFRAGGDKTKKTFWDSVGKDRMVRPWMNPFGAQSSRSQPAATGFMFLKPAWMRALVVFPKGSRKAIGGVDFSQQEFFLSALTSGDQNMIQAYLSGDVYLAFAKLCGMVPTDGTREKFEFERDVCKSTVLGISYLMSKYGLAIKLTQDTKKVWTTDEAQEMIDNFYEAFSGLAEAQKDLIEDYADRKHIKLEGGWYMWGDNDNFRSVTNMRIQGLGAEIMRKSVDIAVSKGLEVVKTLHDALYIQFDVGDEWKLKLLADCMREAFVFYFKGKEIAYEGDLVDAGDLAKNIRLDPKAWSLDYDLDGDKRIEKKEKLDKEGKVVETNYSITVDGYKIPVSHLHIDKRAIKDYTAFSKYFEHQEWLDL